jgi:hypothetical protein
MWRGVSLLSLPVLILILRLSFGVEFACFVCIGRIDG